MQVYFCDDCGQRIPETDIEQGRGEVDEKNNRAVCEACASKAGAVEPKPRTKSGNVRRASSAALAAGRARNRDSGSRRSSARTGDQRGSSDGSNAGMIVVFVAALLVGVGGAYFAVSGGPKPPTRRVAKKPKPSPRPRPVNRKPPPPKPIRPIVIETPTPTPMPVAAKPEKRELTPREEREKMIREGTLPKPPPPKPAPPVATSVSTGAPPAGYGKPAGTKLWADFEAGHRQGWERKATVVTGGFAPGSKHALRIPSGRGNVSTWNRTYTVTDRTVIRMAVWASEDCRSAQIMCWDETASDNARGRLGSNHLKPGQWVVVKLPMRDFYYTEYQGKAVGHSLKGAGIWPSSGYLIIDDIAIYDE